MENKHGGKRENSGRKKKEPTKTIRVPLSKLEEIKKVIGKT
jgi:DNA polymerase V